MIELFAQNSKAQRRAYKGSALTYLRAWAADPATITILVPLVIPSVAQGANYANTTAKTIWSAVSGNAGTRKETLRLLLRHSVLPAGGNPGTIELVFGITSTTNARNATLTIDTFDLDDLAAAHPVPILVACVVTRSGSNVSASIRACVPSNLTLPGRTITNTLFTASGTNTSATLLGGGEALDFLSIGGQDSSEGATHFGTLRGATNRIAQICWVGAPAIYTGNDLSDTDLQALTDRRDMGLVYMAHEICPSMKAAGSAIKWVPNCCMWPGSGGQSILVNASAAQTTLGDPAARVVAAQTRVFDAAQTSSPNLASGYVGLPTSGDVVSEGDAVLVTTPAFVGWPISPIANGEDGFDLDAPLEVAAQAPHIAAMFAGTLSGNRRLVLFSANSRENTAANQDNPGIRTLRHSRLATPTNFADPADLTYANDYETSHVAGIANAFSTGFGAAASSMGEIKLGGFNSWTRRTATLMGPFSGRNGAANRWGNAENIRNGTNNFNNTERDNSADLARLLWCGPSSDSSSGAGMGEGVYLLPSSGAGSTYYEYTVASMFDRNPQDPLTILVVLPKLPGHSRNVRIERGYRNSSAAWVRVDDSHTAIDLDTAVRSGAVNAYTAGATAITLKDVTETGPVRSGEFFVWRRGSSGYFGIGCSVDSADVTTGAVSISSEYRLGSTWSSGGAFGFPQADDSVWIGPMDYEVIAVEFSAAELHATTGTFHNNHVGVRIFNEDADRPACFGQVYPLTMATGCVSLGSIGQSGASYGVWFGTDGATRRQFDIPFDGGAIATRPLGRFIAALAPWLAAWIAKGAQQTSADNAIVTLMQTIAAAAPSCDRVLVADRVLSRQQSDFPVRPPQDSDNWTWWKNTRDALVASVPGTAVTLRPHLACGHPWSQWANGWYRDNVHSCATGVLEEGLAIMDALKVLPQITPSGGGSGATTPLGDMTMAMV